jgi:hypothetical protein
MKKIFLLLFAVAVSSVSLHAQSKITKEKILGKWGIAALEVKGLMYYSVDKDSIILSDSIKTVIKNTGKDPKGLEAVMKQQFASFLAMKFIFDADDTAEISFGLEAQKSKYRVDEEHSTIVTYNESEEEAMNVELAGDMLKIKIPSPEGEFWVFLKKS